MIKLRKISDSNSNRQLLSKSQLEIACLPENLIPGELFIKLYVGFGKIHQCEKYVFSKPIQIANKIYFNYQVRSNDPSLLLEGPFIECEIIKSYEPKQFLNCAGFDIFINKV